ncbi:fused MFS/spermidine synthase [Candidatus Parcubacteria bacterium]|nr:fused MFS/spermidine synthase [Candidatus Parcubacteria bacterium]
MGERQLLVGGLVQSVYPLDSNWERFRGRIWYELAQVVTERKPDSRVVEILGFGGGAVAHLLVRKIPGCRIRAVELDPQVIEVARKFFGIDTIKQLDLQTADAVAGVLDPGSVSNTADTVIVDVYCGGHFPAEAGGEDFLQGVRRRLRPGGLAVFNRIFSRRQSQEQNEFVDKVATVFDNVEVRLVPPQAMQQNVVISGLKGGP